MKHFNGSITTPKGFKVNGIHCGIKRVKPDLGLIVSDAPCVCAGVFTKNSIKAAPLLVSEKHLKNNKAQAIIVNSGNANCFTGEKGYAHAVKMTTALAPHLKLKPEDIIVTSTGIIGKPLPIKKITDGYAKIVKGLRTTKTTQFAKSILTTDKYTKEICIKTTIGGKTITLGGCAKGSGMVAPNMATMLGFVTTDVCITPAMLKAALKIATDQSFNCITIDGCMSTNDMVIVMANGLTGNTTITTKGKDFNSFTQALSAVCLDLAKKIVLDGEGATKFIEVNVLGAENAVQAKKIGLAIANSNLVKTAAYGCNPNWGRVAAAVGSLGIKKITEEKMDITFSSFAKKNITINVNVHCGNAKATAFTSDLSKEYVRINGEYN